MAGTLEQCNGWCVSTEPTTTTTTALFPLQECPPCQPVHEELKKLSQVEGESRKELEQVLWDRQDRVMKRIIVAAPFLPPSAED